MPEEAIHNLLRGDDDLVVIEAPAGCGKTYQGSRYACDVAPNLPQGRMLILTHTNAACDVFAKSTQGLPSSKFEIKTIDAMISQIAAAYHTALDLPPDPMTWAYATNGFAEIGHKVSNLLSRNPMIGRALARRYPIIVCDEHQDASLDHHSIIMSFHENGAKLRIFGDRMQSIYERRPTNAERHRRRWQELVDRSAHGQLDEPHRWIRDDEGCSDLGRWVLDARKTLLNGGTIDLRENLPASVSVIRADNIAQARNQYRLPRGSRAPIDQCVNACDQIFVLASSNDLVQGLRPFWNRRFPIWEGHTRDALSKLIFELERHANSAVELGKALVKFMSAVGTGFTKSSHGDILTEEIINVCARPRRGKPGNIQSLAALILAEPNHLGVAKTVSRINKLMDANAIGFGDIKIDMWREFKEAQKLSDFDDAAQGFAEVMMRRSMMRPKPPTKSLSTVHKAKGLECDNVMLVNCDQGSFGDTIYGRCKLYVALSRAKSSLTLVVPNVNASPLLIC